MLFLTGNKEKRLKKLEKEKKNAINRISSYQEEIQRAESLAFKKSFPSEEKYNDYVKKLKENLLKAHDKLIEICKREEEEKGNA